MSPSSIKCEADFGDGLRARGLRQATLLCTWGRGRQRGTTLGRLYFVSPTAGEFFYLRTLLTTIKAPTSWENLRTFDRVVHPTFTQCVIIMVTMKKTKYNPTGGLQWLWAGSGGLAHCRGSPWLAVSGLAPGWLQAVGLGWLALALGWLGLAVPGRSTGTAS